MELNLCPGCDAFIRKDWETCRVCGFDLLAPVPAPTSVPVDDAFADPSTTAPEGLVPNEDHDAPFEHGDAIDGDASPIIDPTLGVPMLHDQPSDNDEVPGFEPLGYDAPPDDLRVELDEDEAVAPQPEEEAGRAVGTVNASDTIDEVLAPVADSLDASTSSPTGPTNPINPIDPIDELLLDNGPSWSWTPTSATSATSEPQTEATEADTGASDASTNSWDGASIEGFSLYDSASTSNTRRSLPQIPRRALLGIAAVIIMVILAALVAHFASGGADDGTNPKGDGSNQPHVTTPAASTTWAPFTDPNKHFRAELPGAPRVDGKTASGTTSDGTTVFVITDVLGGNADLTRSDQLLKQASQQLASATGTQIKSSVYGTVAGRRSLDVRMSNATDFIDVRYFFDDHTIFGLGVTAHADTGDPVAFGHLTDTFKIGA